MRSQPARVVALAILAAIATFSTVIPAAAKPTAAPARPGLAEPTPGAPTSNDPVFPTLGNGGYHVDHYALELRVGATHEPFPASVGIDATATQSLSRFYLDFAGNTLTSVTVNEAKAKARRVGAKLEITPAKPIWRGESFQVGVDYTADPTRTGGDSGWVNEPDGFVWSGQPSGAHTLFPCDDVPSEKATFSFHIVAPNDETVVANGELVNKYRDRYHTEWSYRSYDKIATELAQVAVGHYTVVTATGPRNLPVRSVVPTKDVAKLKPRLDRLADHLKWLEGQLGDYPFGTYGVLAAPDKFHWALETQTLSLFSSKRLQDPLTSIEPVMVHELAHQWFGDSVTPADWSDVWLNEGHATWYEGTYSSYRGWKDRGGFASFDDRMKAAYHSSNTWRAKFGPPGRPTAANFFSPDVYDGAALVLYALRAKVGTDTFAQIERTWVAWYRSKTADTADFIHLASRLAGPAVTDFLAAWLYGAKVPPMPGHPDWRP